ncbi:hypothetical protein [Longimicrobium sp.]|uniref:hypothetical protein n=1 Tax=Longimicrobium sp. TaxID=2029185 RepID=UPI002E34C142|nr:hypothetical protein [Longimicrobium sp.]HEX6039446.1 hypothetical protein [Longimicrobium sp.]
MSKPRVYVETTIPNFYYDFRPSEAVALRRDATRRWWATAAERYELVTSTSVQFELSAGRGAAVPMRLELLAGIPVLPAVTRVREIVAIYIKHKLMPARPGEDAMHLDLPRTMDVI